MLFALCADVVVRRLVDGYSGDERAPLPYDEQAEARGEAHRWWTEMLIGRFELLLLEYEWSYGDLTAALSAINDELLRVSLGGSIF